MLEEQIELTAARLRTLVADIEQLEAMLSDNESFRAAQNVRASVEALRAQLVLLLRELGADVTPLEQMKAPTGCPPSFAPPSALCSD
jgi:hypothetical protein